MAFEAAKADVKRYYEEAMSERIAEYTKSRGRAISRAQETGNLLSTTHVCVQYFF